VRALPIKLADGRIKDTGVKVVLNEAEDESDSVSDEGEKRGETSVEDVSTGARFGRPAVVDVLQTKSRTKRMEVAKEQIASICQEVLADPENSVSVDDSDRSISLNIVFTQLGLLRRLHTFSLPTVTTPAHPEPVSNDPLIRQLTILSQLAVFKDIIPGYRIRPLTEIEKAEKVSQMVAQTRDWEQGLVSVYQAYLQLLEAEFKGVYLFSGTHSSIQFYQERVISLTSQCIACARS
jgi:nucleolar complex protein 3